MEYQVGSYVDVYSASKNKWYVDGIVTDVDARGSLRVLYNKSSTTEAEKSIPQSKLAKYLRPHATGLPETPDVGAKAYDSIGQRQATEDVTTRLDVAVRDAGNDNQNTEDETDRQERIRRMTQAKLETYLKQNRADSSGKVDVTSDDESSIASVYRSSQQATEHINDLLIPNVTGAKPCE